MTPLTEGWAAVPTIFSTVLPLGIFSSQVRMNKNVQKCPPSFMQFKGIVRPFELLRETRLIWRGLSISGMALNKL